MDIAAYLFALLIGLYVVVTRPIVKAIARHLDYWKGQ